MADYVIDGNGVMTITRYDRVLGGDNFISVEDKSKITKIIVPEGVEEIENSTFKWIKNLTSVELPNSLKIIGESAFSYCKKLENVKLGSGLKVIDEEAFADTKLKVIDLPDSVEKIGSFAFKKADLRSVKLPKSLKSLDSWVFINNKNLSKVELSDGLEDIDISAFSDCEDLREIVVPETVKHITEITMDSFDYDHMVLPMTAFMESRAMYNLRKRIKESKGNSGDFKCEFLLNGKVVKANEIKNMSSADGVTIYEYGENGDVLIIKNGGQPLMTNRKHVYRGTTKWNHLDEVSLRYANRILDWNTKYDVLPHKSVVVNMPKSDIELFYKNNNAKNWASIVKSCILTEDANRDTLFELAYALGVFSENGKESKDATDFMIESVIGNYDEFEIHSKFSGLGVYSTKYNTDFAKFFMTNFKKNPNFLIAYNPMTDDTFNFCPMVYREFNDIMKAFPNKKIITRQDNDRLTPELAISYFTERRYDNVASEAKDLAKMIGRYGYSQEDYKRIEEWFLTGLILEKTEKQALKANKDFMIDALSDLQGKMLERTGENIAGNVAVSEEPEIVECERLVDLNHFDKSKVITYELIEKSNAMGAVLGNMTNCCQVLNGAGESCLKYGMTEPNSGFVAFRNEEKLIGQAWVWYDEKEKTVCLDNIEVPTKMLEILRKDSVMQNQFIYCLIRLKNGVQTAMGKDKVNKVTIGLGYNDISKVLEQNFKMDNNAKTLTNYEGYTDAKSQFVITDKQQEKKVDKNVKEERQM